MAPLNPGRDNEDAPVPACPYCNPELNPVQAEEGEWDDTATSTLNDAPGTSEFPNTGMKRKEKTGKECKHFSCIPCKRGGLCRKEFHGDDRPHSGHTRLKIFRVKDETCVRKEDMTVHFDTTSVMGTSLNNHTVQRLRTVKASYVESNIVMQCKGCQENVVMATSFPWGAENGRNATVCSIQCLLASRAQERQVNFTGAHRRKQLWSYALINWLSRVREFIRYRYIESVDYFVVCT